MLKFWKNCSINLQIVSILFIQIFSINEMCKLTPTKDDKENKHKSEPRVPLLVFLKVSCLTTVSLLWGLFLT